jgi:transglutaminase-like putative cysteine protease
MTILSVRHVTTYRYRKPVSFGEHRMMFRPRDSYDQRLIDSTLFITPEPIGIYWIHDPFGNCVALARFKRQASELRFESRIRVDHYPWNVPDFQTDPQAKSYPFAYSSDEIPDLTPSIARGYPDPEGEIDRWVRKFLRPGRPTPTGKLLMTLTHGIKEGFTYTRRAEHGTQEPVATVRIGRGSCRDFAC